MKLAAVVLFALHAYLIHISGDMPIKGHNGYYPCCMCKITSIRVPNSCSPVHNVPLDRSSHPEVRSLPTAIKKFNTRNLLMRTHIEMMAQGQEIQLALTAAEADCLAKSYGVKGVLILIYLSSISFPKSFPHNFMHLIWENTVKKLVMLWMREFKGIDTGLWEAIGKATAASGETLPVVTERSACTADTWSFWTQYLGPVLLRQNFSKAKYYKHFVKLVKMLHVCLQFEHTAQDVEDLQVGFESWVEEFKE
ncbi:hypothetical protein F4604DRAFT_1884249 [Suillus subluteus]|nr:hypothetical protein F4604DRAFT_1884249 [Suillus subluteus]